MSSAMTTPSKRTGIQGAHVVLLLALILFLGLALAPRTFEFRAWPEAARQDAIEEVVDRPVREVEVAGVERTAREARQGRPPAAEGSSRGRRRAARGAAPRERARSGRSSRRRPAPEAPAAAPDAPVEEAPPAETPAPEEPAPQQPAQLAEAPSADVVLRPEVEEQVAPDDPPLRAFGAGDEGELDVRDQGRHGPGGGHRRHGR
jgi:hypothetical protein